MKLADYQRTAKRKLLKHLNDFRTANEGLLTEDDVVVVWFSKTLQNWKALLICGASIDEGIYYELTHNGDQRETYVDIYKKLDTVVVTD